MDEDQKRDWLNELYDTSYHKLRWITDDIFDTQANISMAAARGKKRLTRKLCEQLRLRVDDLHNAVKALEERYLGLRQASEDDKYCHKYHYSEALFVRTENERLRKTMRKFGRYSIEDLDTFNNIVNMMKTFNITISELKESVDTARLLKGSIKERKVVKCITKQS